MDHLQQLFKLCLAGKDAQFTTEIQTWTINRVKKNENNLTSDDAFLISFYQCN